MPRWLRILLRILIGFAGLVLLLWLGLIGYVSAHKQEILKEITARLSEKTKGTLTIKDMQPSLWKSFPNISIALQDISLHDSLYDQHKHNLLEAKTLFVKLNTFELLSKRTEIQKISVAHGSIYLYTDSTGYTNSYLLSSRDTAKKKSKKETIFEHFGFEDVQLSLVNRVKFKRFLIHINSLDGSTVLENGIWKMHIRTDAHVDQFCFNTIRGSYLKNKDLDINFDLSYDPQKKKLFIPDQQMKISGQPLNLTALFIFGDKPASFEMGLHSSGIPYKTAVSWVSQNIAKKLDSFDFARPVAVDVRIKGVMKYKNIPTIKVSYTIVNNKLMTPAGDVDDVSFTGYYFNEAIAGMGHGDDNSQLQFQQVKGNLEHHPLPDGHF